jgi:hypothetical protein
LLSALTTPTLSNTREKKKKRKNKKKTQQAIESQRKDEEQDHLKKTSLGPLRQGQRLDTSETKPMLKQRAQTTEPKLEHHKELHLNICKLPLNQCSNATRECSKEQKLLTKPRSG